MIGSEITVKQEFYDMNAAITEASHEAKDVYWEANRCRPYEIELVHVKSKCTFIAESTYMNRCWVHTFKVEVIS